MTLLQFMFSIRQYMLTIKEYLAAVYVKAYNSIWLSEWNYKHWIKGYLAAVHDKHTITYGFQQGNIST